MSEWHPTLDPGDELAQLRNDLDEAREQLSATGEILLAIGASASDLEAVLGTVVESARRLCRADTAQIYLLEDDAVPGRRRDRRVR